MIRRYADGAVANEEGDTFELRMVDAGGAVLAGSRNPVLRLTIPPGHVGGTFVETPGRVGPWQAPNGDLYFIMEPAETDNLFMMIKSSDGGVTWREMDGANRPETNDLESVDGRQVGDTIHIIHQVTDSIRYHAFRTSDHPTRPDTWDVRDERAATVPLSPRRRLSPCDRTAALSLSMSRTPSTTTSARREASGVLTPSSIRESARNQPVPSGARRERHRARRLLRHGRHNLVSAAPARRHPDAEAAARVGPGHHASGIRRGTALVFIARTNTVVIIYRQSDGRLWERRIINDGAPTPAVQVTDRFVIQDAVDSQQPAADAVLDGKTVRVLFVEQTSRSIFSTHDDGGWQPSTLRVDSILGSWIRGNVYTRSEGRKVHGYIYDAGSDGGAGMNRFGEFVLTVR